MASTRRLMRAVIADTLMDKTRAGSSVHLNRSTPLWLEHLPSIVIYTARDSAEERDASQWVLYRDLEVDVDCHLEARASQTIDDDLDDFADEVEQLVFPLFYPLTCQFEGNLNRSQYAGMEAFALNDEGGRDVMGARLRFIFSYSQKIEELDPADVAAFLRAWVEYDVEPQDGTIDSEQHILVPQI